MSHPIGTLYTTLFNALKPIGTVYAEFAPVEAHRPYTVFFLVSGGNMRNVPKNRQMMTITVKCVADTLADAFNGASSISGILDDAGLFDGGVLIGDVAWDVCTITQNEMIKLIEWDEDVKPIYHAGYSYEVVMEEK